MRIAIAQLDPTVGDLDGNLGKMLGAAREAARQQAQLVVFPAHALTGAPLSGLACSQAFIDDAKEHLDRFVADCPLVALVSCVTLLGGHEADGEDDAEPQLASAEALYIVADGQAEILTVPAIEETRACPIVEVAGSTLAVLFDGHFPQDAAFDGVDALVELCAGECLDDEAAPAACGMLERHRVLAESNGAFLACANLCGAADVVVYSGNSLAMAPNGRLVHAAPPDAPETFVFDTVRDQGNEQAAETARIGREELLWRYIVAATRDYVAKNGFSDAVVGLSGGIDSAVVATVAADALGAEHVHGVLMPGPYSSEGSIADAAKLAANLGIETETVAIDGPLESLHAALGTACGGAVDGLAAENLQARIRAVYLMTVSNARGWVVLNTGNKSEAAMGFSTLYGDTVGAYAPIGGLYKTDVYALARWRAARKSSIPQACIDKAPSAELYPDATDQDRLPPYETLDELLFDHVEQGMGAAELVDAGYDAALVDEVLRTVSKNEFKRRLEPPAPQVTGLPLTEGRAWPVTNGWCDRLS